jgi:hypothetical protein
VASLPVAKGSTRRYWHQRYVPVRNSESCQPYLSRWITPENLLSVRLPNCHCHGTFERTFAGWPSMGTSFFRTDSALLTLCYAERTL